MEDRNAQSSAETLTLYTPDGRELTLQVGAVVLVSDEKLAMGSYGGVLFEFLSAGMVRLTFTPVGCDEKVEMMRIVHASPTAVDNVQELPKHQPVLEPEENAGQIIRRKPLKTLNPPVLKPPSPQDIGGA